MSNEMLRDAVDLWQRNKLGADATYGPMSQWDTSQVTDMSRLFEGAVDFNSNDLQSWDTSRVTSFSYIFAGCRTFNQPLNMWDLSSARNLEGMLNGAQTFNQYLTTGGWQQTSNVTSMAAMFKGASSFNGDVSGLDTSNVENMSLMFYQASSFEGTGVEKWDVSNVERMDRLFMGASSFNGEVQEWKPQKAATMFSMFEDAVSFSQDLNSWRQYLSRELINISKMFNHAQTFQYAICWPNLNPRIQAYNIFCGSPGSLRPSCFTPSVVDWAASCDSATSESSTTMSSNHISHETGFDILASEPSQQQGGTQLSSTESPTTPGNSEEQTPQVILAIQENQESVTSTGTTIYVKLFSTGTLATLLGVSWLSWIVL